MPGVVDPAGRHIACDSSPGLISFGCEGRTRVNILKGFKYGAAALLAVCVLFLLALGLINAFDEDLNPEIVALVHRAETEQIAQQGNAYFALVGLSAPHGQDMEVAGKSLHEENQRQLEISRKTTGFRPIDPYSRPGGLSFEGELSYMCSVWQDYLYENGVCKHQAESDRMLAENQELLQRYYRLLDYHAYEEPAIGNIPSGRDLIDLAGLATVDIERRLAHGQVAQSAELMVRNLAFWRNALEGKYRMVPEAVLRIGYSVSQQWSSQLLWRHPQLLEKANFKAAFARPFMISADRLQWQLDREFMNAYSVRRGSDMVLFEGSGRSRNPILRWVADRLFRRNATLNDYYACTKRFYAVRGLGAEAFGKAVAEYRDYSIDDAASLAVNLTGKIALYEHCPKGSWLEEFNYERFEASRRLVSLEIELLRSKLPKRRYAAFLAAAPASLRDPLNGQPAKWDAGRQIIFFEREAGCLSDGHWVNLAPVRDIKRCRP